MMGIRFKAMCATVGAVVWFNASLSALAAVSGVNIEDDFFSPSTSSIHAGDSVVWTWVGTDGHNVTSTSTPQLWKATATKAPPFSFTNSFPSTGTFPYECSIHAKNGMLGTVKVAAALANPPTVTITTPAAGSSFAAPATITIGASTTDASGTVTNVQFLLGSTVIGQSASAPFGTVANNVAAGSYSITAVATDSNDLKATNSVTVVVYTPVSEQGAAMTSPGVFQFSFSADNGASYIVQRSTNFVDWVPLSTNSATSDAVTFTDDNAPESGGFYRVEIAPNP